MYIRCVSQKDKTLQDLCAKRLLYKIKESLFYYISEQIFLNFQILLFNLLVLHKFLMVPWPLSGLLSFLSGK